MRKIFARSNHEIKLYSLNILKIWYNLNYQTYTNTCNSSLDKRQNWTSISACVKETEENVSSITDGNTVCHAVFAQWFYRNISLTLLGLWIVVGYKKIACSNNLHISSKWYRLFKLLSFTFPEEKWKRKMENKPVSVADFRHYPQKLCRNILKNKACICPTILYRTKGSLEKKTSASQGRNRGKWWI